LAAWLKQPRTSLKREKIMKKLVALSMTMLLASALSSLAADGKENYDKSCASCHGKDGKGDTKMGKKEGVKDYADAKSWEGLDDAKAFKSVKEGMKEGDKVKMKPFADKLSDDDIKAVITYMRTLKK
jgi:mono/diheme cytochrome c family protein